MHRNALKFVNPNNPNDGMFFDGRIAEDFKLDTGTWVSVGTLKEKFIAAAKGLIQDIVITGHDRAFVGAIIFPEINYCKKLAGLNENDSLENIINHPNVLNALQNVLVEYAKHSTGSSTLIKRAIFANFILSIDKGEVTDKGSINQRVILKNHEDIVKLIYEKNLNAPVLSAEL